ncbi:MAG: citrate/2-methylcitrate synthase [Hyphomonas sp.]|uniref:citrate/2-methylcitrate synthase n=1 Tax=Hyphomonas sp. TaxID=87 RepID=UPI0034A02F0B
MACAIQPAIRPLAKIRKGGIIGKLQSNRERGERHVDTRVLVRDFLCTGRAGVRVRRRSFRPERTLAWRAPRQVLDMVDAIGAPENAAAWIDGALPRGERLTGFGHRVCRVRGPRADALKAAVARLPGTSGRRGFAEHIERAVLGRLTQKHPQRQLDTNADALNRASA